MANVTPANVARPANVPAEARYAALEGWFEVGKLKKGRRFGSQPTHQRQRSRNHAMGLLARARSDDLVTE